MDVHGLSNHHALEAVHLEGTPANGEMGHSSFIDEFPFDKAPFLVRELLN